MIMPALDEELALPLVLAELESFRAHRDPPRATSPAVDAVLQRTPSGGGEIPSPRTVNPSWQNGRRAMITKSR